VNAIDSWADAYDAIVRDLEARRGYVELDHAAWPQRWPRSTGADVIRIAGVIDRALAHAPAITGADDVRETWRGCQADVERLAWRAARDERRRTYPESRAFWAAVATVCSYLDAARLPPPARAFWDRFFAGERIRNAAPVVETFLDLAAVSEQALGVLRGFDGDRVPLLSVGDSLALLDLWTEIVGQSGERLGVAADRLVDRWGRLVGDAIAVAMQLDPADRYPDGGRVVYEVRRLAGYLDHATALASGGFGDALRAGFRNAATMTIEAGKVKLEGLIDLIGAWGAMARYFKEKRGAVLEPNVPAGRKPGELPNTTVSEVLWLVDFWTKKLAEVDAANLERENWVYKNVRLITGAPKRTDEAAAAIAAWSALVAHVLTVAKPLKADDVYPENWTVWSGAGDFAIALDALRKAPVAPSLAEAWDHTWHGLPDRLAGAGHAVENVVEKGYDAIKGAAKDVAGEIGDVVGGVGDALGDALGGLVKPIVIGGAVVIGAAILVPVLLRG
jgi:hypothetical protein